MPGLFLTAVLASGVMATDTAPPITCPEDIRATATVRRLSELPQEVRDDLLLFTDNEIGESDLPLLQTDAPGPAERNHLTVRFARALLIRDLWFVQFEVTLFAGVRTVGYHRQPDGRFQRLPAYYFNGPPCESIRAALSGVTTPGGF